MSQLERLRRIERHCIEHGGQPCKHGHLSCSDREGGPCQDELYQTLDDDARAAHDEDCI